MSGLSCCEAALSKPQDARRSLPLSIRFFCSGGLDVHRAPPQCGVADTPHYPVSAADSRMESFRPNLTTPRWSRSRAGNYTTVFTIIFPSCDIRVTRLLQNLHCDPASARPPVSERPSAVRPGSRRRRVLEFLVWTYRLACARIMKSDLHAENRQRRPGCEVNRWSRKCRRSAQRLLQ
jgi:hypothetical protein